MPTTNPNESPRRSPARSRPCAPFGRAVAVLCAAQALGAPACHRSPGEVIEQRREIMGTTFVVRIYAEPSDDLYDAIGKAFDRIEEIESLLGESVHDSDVARLNQAAGEKAVAVGPDTIRVLQLALDVSRRSEGAFDVTWAALRNAWNFNNADAIKPDEDAFRAKVERLRQRVGYARLEIDPEAGTARLADRGMQIGLGAVLKGLALDEASAVLWADGMRDYVVEGGGDLIVRGRRGDRDWTVGIRHPRSEAPEVFAVIPVRDRAVATTGDYARFRIVEGVRYSHVIDPRTGFPARTCVSTTVIHPSGMVADALATAAFVLGPVEGLRLIEGYAGAEGMIVDPNLGVHVTPGLAAVVKVRWLKTESQR